MLLVAQDLLAVGGLAGRRSCGDWGGSGDRGWLLWRLVLLRGRDRRHSPGGDSIIRLRHGRGSNSARLLRRLTSGHIGIYV